MIGERLAAIGPRVAIVERDVTFTGDGLSHAAAALAGCLASARRLLLWSGRASDVLLALAACEAAGAELYLAHRTLAWAQVEEIVAEQSIDAVWRENDAAPDQRPCRETGPALPGAIHLMTSGTTGAPKIVRHRLATLTGSIKGTANSAEARLLLAYPATSFAGMQVILSALTGGGTLIVPAGNTPAELCAALRRHRVTHMSGTPSLWRKVLLALDGSERLEHLRNITLGGEAVDQGTLDRLARQFPNARIRHIYASTEAGVLFTIGDHRAGFPPEVLRDGVGGVAFRVRDGVLEVRSPRPMQRYVSPHALPFDEEGWMSTGDVVAERNGRWYFQGRADGRLNVGGYKVFPEQVEEAALAVAGVADARVFGQPGPLAGDVLIAEIVPESGQDHAELRGRVLRGLRASLPAFAVPRIVRFTDFIAVSPFQKKSRSYEPQPVAHCD
jgi:acyl-CoA synthetase (AMP-forming)/AMP-acid ligase II